MSLTYSLGNLGNLTFVKFSSKNGQVLLHGTVKSKDVAASQYVCEAAMSLGYGAEASAAQVLIELKRVKASELAQVIRDVFCEVAKATIRLRAQTAPLPVKRPKPRRQSKPAASGTVLFQPAR